MLLQKRGDQALRIAATVSCAMTTSWPPLGGNVEIYCKQPCLPVLFQAAVRVSRVRSGHTPFRPLAARYRSPAESLRDRQM